MSYSKYLIPICDIEAGSVWIKSVMAKSIPECKEKIMNYLIEYYDFDYDSDYSDFVKWLDESQNILIGKITDIDEI